MPDYQIESKFASDGAVIGVDEAGRGPWAGPVTAAAFWIEPSSLTSLPDRLTDSKKLTALQRQSIRDGLVHTSSPHLYRVCHADNHLIDEIGILNACFQAMQTAVNELAAILSARNIPIAQVIVDGNILPQLPYPAQAVVRGDSLSLSVAAASIMAKTERDAVMAELDRVHPEYGWKQNAGYGTRQHQDALHQYGPTPYHRYSFKPLSKLLPEKTPEKTPDKL